MILGFSVVKPFYLSQIGNADVEIMEMGIEYLSTVMIFSFGLFTQFFFERLLTSTGRTIFSMTSQLTGAVTNIILNLLFTPFIGALGAAIATAICYFEVWFLRYYHSKKIITLKINLKRDIISYVLLVVQSVILIIIDNEIMLYGVQTFIFVLMMLLYMNDIIELIRKIQNFLSKKQGSSV